jgi:hypothetical protein
MTIARGEPMLATDILNLTFFPKGTILTFSSTAWSATSVEFKNIWKICNAANHAVDPTIPDLTNKFLRGADSSGTTGGADSRSVTLTNNNLPSHSHGASGLSLSGLSLSGLKATSSGAHEHTLSGKTASDGSHSHGITDPQHDHTTPPIANTDDTGGGPPLPYLVADERMYSGGLKVGKSSTGVSVNSTNSAHSHTFSSDSKAFLNGAHEHDVTGSITGGSISGSTANAGDGVAFSISIVPLYCTVIYIIKVI